MGGIRYTGGALAEVGTLLLGGTGVVLSAGVIGSLVTARQSGPVLALLLAVALLAALGWPRAWAALLVGRTPAAAVAGVVWLLASLAVPAFYTAGSGTGADAWRALVMPAVVATALVGVVARGSAPGPPCRAGRGVALLAGTVLASPCRSCSTRR